MNDYTMMTPPPIFEWLIHLLEFSVVVGIAVMVYVTKKYPKKNKEVDESRIGPERQFSNDITSELRDH